jgi:hypothetical protein
LLRAPMGKYSSVTFEFHSRWESSSISTSNTSAKLSSMIVRGLEA